MKSLNGDLHCKLHFYPLHTGNRCRSMELRPVFSRGPHDRQGARAESATAFCLSRPDSPRPRHRARAYRALRARPTGSQIKIAMQ